VCGDHGALDLAPKLGYFQRQDGSNAEAVSSTRKTSVKGINGERWTTN
jgi:hypothetical protein